MVSQIAPKGFAPLDGTATRNAIQADNIALKGHFAGAQTAVRRSWAMPFKGRGSRCTFEKKPGVYCAAYHTKDSEFCVGHKRAADRAAATAADDKGDD